MESIEKFLYTWQDDFLEDLDINEKNNLTYASYERIINYFIDIIVFYGLSSYNLYFN